MQVHPSHEALLRYSISECPAEEDATISEHVSLCFDCAELMQEIQDGLDSLPFTEMELGPSFFGAALAALFGQYCYRPAAETLGLSTKTIERYETGQRQIPMPVWCRLDEALATKGQQIETIRRELLARLGKES